MFSQNKDTHQPCSYCRADLHLWFCIDKNSVFSGSFIQNRFSNELVDIMLIEILITFTFGKHAHAIYRDFLKL